jgi:hypothetical protein
VQPVSDLNDEEKFGHEGHVDVRVVLPQQANGEEVFAPDDICRPHDADQIKGQELSRFVELGMFNLGKVQLSVNPVQEVLLNNLK